MNRERVSTRVFLSILMMMLLMVTIGCSSKDDDNPTPAATYSVSGTVVGASDVTMNLTGDATATKTTATDGTYSFTGLAVGNYTVIPVKAGYTFNPLSQGGHLTANQTSVDFTATANAGLTYSISGAVSGAVLAGVTITLAGDANAVTVTNSSGNYSFPGIALNGNYTVTPSLEGYTFSAISTAVIVSGADSTGNNFTATANTATTYSISGAVSGAAVAGVTITLSGGAFGTAITTTGAGGTYSFNGLLPGDYVVTPSLAGYTFSPTDRSITLIANSTGNNFTSTNVSAIYSISGTVSGASGVTIYLTGAANASTTGGSFSFTGLANGTYTVTPVLAGYTFAPASLAVTVAGGNITGRDFTATVNAALKYSISGMVSGDVKSGVTITLSGAGSATTTTNVSGNYSFSGLVAGSYTVTPTLAGYTIAPLSLSPTISGANVTGQNFVVGTAPVAFSQADLTGTWRVNMLRKGFRSDGTTPRNEWIRGRLSIDGSGNVSCVAMSNSTDATTCPSSIDWKMTINSSGVISETGADAAANGHATMTSTKNFIAETGTGGNPSYHLAIVQKEEGASYSAADVQNKNFVYHQLEVGTDSKWRYGVGSTNGTGALNISSETTPSGTTTPGDVGVQLVLDTATGIVTMSGGGMTTYQGFLSSDKKTIVGTFTDGSNYKLMIIQITGTEFTIGPMPAGIAFAHMLATGTGFAGWVHCTNTVVPGGGMTFSDWASSFGSSAPSAAYTANITTTSGTLTITGNPTYHGQISYDRKFSVGTQTPQTGIYMLNVTTK